MTEKEKELRDDIAKSIFLSFASNGDCHERFSVIAERSLNAADAFVECLSNKNKKE